MKKSLQFTFFVLFFICTYTQIRGQEPEKNIDSMLVDIDKTNLTSNILYDRVYPWAKLDEFNGGQSISNKQHFEQSLQELYLASNKSKFMSYKSFRKNYTSEKIKNKVDIGIINTTFHKLNFKENRQREGGLKIINKKFKRLKNDKPVFISKNILVISPLKEYLRGKTITYNFDSKFFLQDTRKRKIMELIANFDTSQKYEIIKNGEFTSTSIKVDYTNDGIKTLTFIARFYDGSSETTKSTIHVKTSTPPPGLITLVSDYPFEGVSDYGQFYNPHRIDHTQIRGEIQYRIFYRLINGIPATSLHKPIIIIDGFDPLDNRKIIDEDSDLLAEDHRSIEDMMVYNVDESEVNLIHLLRQKGYDVIIVNHPTYFIGVGWPAWPRINGGADFIERNAMNHITLYQRLNETLKQNGSPEKLVIVGPSMGGQISRYALAYMEKKYANTGNELWNHNTRIWISVDSPHLGANIPMGAQSLLNTLKDYTNSVGAAEFVNSWLGSAAAKQQLIEQYNGRNGNELIQDHLDAKTISQGYFQDKGSPYFVQYYNNLFNNGLPNSNGYPQNVRRLALVNGSLSGSKEFNNPFEDNGTDLSGSIFNDVFPNNSAQVLKIEGNANIIGKIVQLESYFMPATSSRSKISYFKKKKTFGWNYYYRYITNYNSRGNLDNIPGGWFPAQKDIAAEVEGSHSSEQITSGLFDWSIAVNKWYIRNLKHVSSFIPTVSSLGIKNPNFNWSQRLDNRNLVCSNEIPFDSYFGPKKNEQHTSFTQESVDWILKELGTNTEAPSPQDPHFPLTASSLVGSSTICDRTTQTYSFSGCSIPGDVENWTTSTNLQIISRTGNSITVKAPADYRSQGTITATFGNGEEVTKTIWIGKPKTPRSISGPTSVSQEALVRYSGSYLSGATGYQWRVPYYRLPFPNTVRWQITSGANTPYMTALAGSFSGLVQFMGRNKCGVGGAETLWVEVDGGGGGAMKSAPPVQNGTASIYPNPVDKELNINFNNMDELSQNSVISLYDINGKLVFKRKGNSESKTIDTSNFAEGLYVLVVNNGANQIRNKIIIQH